MEDFRNMKHLFKLLNYMVSSMGFPHLFLLGAGSVEYMALLTKVL